MVPAGLKQYNLMVSDVLFMDCGYAKMTAKCIYFLTYWDLWWVIGIILYDLLLHLKCNLPIDANSPPSSNFLYLFHLLLLSCFNLITKLNSQPAWSTLINSTITPQWPPALFTLLTTHRTPNTLSFPCCRPHICILYIYVCMVVMVVVRVVWGRAGGLGGYTGSDSVYPVYPEGYFWR